MRIGVMLAAIVFPAVAAAQAPPLEFKGLRFGLATESDVKERLGLELVCSGIPLYTCRAEPDGLTYADEHAKSFTFDFIDGKLASVTVVLIHRASRDRLADTIAQKYGRRISNTTEPMKHWTTGAPYMQRRQQWRLTGGILELQDNEPPVDMLLVIASGNAKLRWYSEQRRSKPKAKSDM